jgi:PAS domain S-box-containing protein
MPSLPFGTMLWPGLMLLVGVAAAASVAWLGAALRASRRQLRDSREAFHTLAAEAPVGILQADANGMCVSANEAWCQLTGLTQEQTVGHRWNLAVHPDDVADVMRKWEESVRAAKPYLNQVRVVRPDGSIRTVMATARPVRDDRDRLTGFVGTVMDVTDVLAAQKKLRDQESLLQSLVDHSSAVIYLKDLEGRYLLVNKRHMDLWPSMKDFRPGTTPYEWFPPETARAFLETDAQVARSGRELTFTETVEHDGETHSYVSVKFPVTDEKGQAIAVGGISTDVTELQQARLTIAEREQVLRRLIDVQEKEKQQLCHEFHDGIIQYSIGAIMLLDSLAHDDRTLSDEARGTITSATDCLRRGVEDGRRSIRGIRPAALDDLGLASAIEELLDQMREAGVAVTAHLDPDIDGIASNLQTTAYRVVQEALTNVRKHSGSETVEVTLERTPDALEVSVVDKGCGFDVKAVGRTGFGLVGMSERVRLVGGECRIESTPGKGTTVAIRLPLAAAAEA